MKLGWKAALVVAACLGSSAVATAQETRLYFTSQSPAGSRNVAWFTEWANRVNAQSAGTLKVEVKEIGPLANFANAYNRVLDDVVQIGWAPHPLIGGKFPLSEVAGLPFLADDSEQAAVALWRLYRSGALDAEYTDVIPIWLGIFPQNQVHFRKSVPSVNDLRGFKISSSARTQGQLTARLNGAPISIQTTDVYEALQRGTIDGSMISWAAFVPYKLAEVSNYHVEAPIGAWTFMFFMSRAKWNALPPAAKKALEANGGEAQSRAWGKFLDGEFASARATVAAMANHTIVQLNPQQRDTWRAAAVPVIDEWKKSRPSGEQAGQKIVEAYSKLLAEVKAGK
jgi:TRAP-type C4-dicarboxylate transport system substrate-binding protein